MNRNAHLMISEGIDKTARSSHNEKEEAKYAIQRKKRTNRRFKR
jgi:hypothetical protein